MVWQNRLALRLITSPVLFGGLGSVAFHAAMHAYPSAVTPWLARCLTGRWECYVCTTLFLVAIAMLVKTGLYVALQMVTLHRFAADGSADSGSGRGVDLETQMEMLESHAWTRLSLLCRRLRNALQRDGRPDSARPFSERRQELADADYDRMQVRYSVLRLLIWAIPSCASVAAILAMAQAIETIAPDSAAEVVTAAIAGLSQAFTIFAVFTGLAILLVAFKFVLEQAEQHVLTAVDGQVSLALSDRLQAGSDGTNSSTAQFHQVVESLKLIAGSLTQQVSSARRAQVEPARGTSGTAQSLAPQDIESSVQKAVSLALQGQATAGSAGSVSSMDGAGWQTLQDVLRKLAAVLEQQNAKLDAESRLAKQLSAMIGDDFTDSTPLARSRGEARSGDDLVTVLGQ